MIGRWYRTSKYVIGIELEKVNGAGFTGISTKAGDLITLQFKDCEFTGGTIPDKAYVCLAYDALIKISDGGLLVYE